MTLQKTFQFDDVLLLTCQYVTQVTSDPG